MDFKEESSLPSMRTPPPSVKFLLLAFSVVQIQLQDFQLSCASGQERQLAMQTKQSAI